MNSAAQQVKPWIAVMFGCFVGFVIAWVPYARGGSIATAPISALCITCIGGSLGYSLHSRWHLARRGVLGELRLVIPTGIIGGAAVALVWFMLGFSLTPDLIGSVAGGAVIGGVAAMAILLTVWTNVHTPTHWR